jgi:hypothetical protein
MNISKYLETISLFVGAKFELYGQPIENEKVFSTKGLLPAFTKRSENNALFTINITLGAQFKKNSQAVAGLEVEYNDQIPNSYRILCIMDVLFELMQNQQGQERINLDQLLYD